jgi:hypothetical protein
MDDGSGRRSAEGLLQASRRAGDMRTRDGDGKGNTVGNPVVHFEIGGKIADRTRAFYCAAALPGVAPGVAPCLSRLAAG